MTDSSPTQLLNLDTLVALERLRSLRAVRIASASRPLADGLLCRRERGTWANVAIGLGLTRDITPPEVVELIGYFTEIGKDARAEVCDRARPTLLSALADAGFHLRTLVSVLGLRLDSARPMQHVALPTGVTIQRLNPADRPLCEATSRVLAAAFAPEGQPPHEDDLAANLAGLTHPHTLGYVAMADGRPIGAGLMDVQDGLATLWGAAVAPEFRRRGIQQALVEHRLRHAMDAGAKLVTVETSAGGPTHRNAARRGFELLYTRAIVGKKVEWA